MCNFIKSLNKMGINITLESVAVLFLVSFIYILSIDFIFGIYSEVPSVFISVIEEFVSIRPFVLLFSIALFFLTFITIFVKQNPNTVMQKILIRIGLPVCKATIDFGAVTISFLLGIGSSSHLLNWLKYKNEETHLIFYNAAILVFMLTYLITHFTVLFEDKEGVLYASLMVIFVLYVFFVIRLFFCSLSVVEIPVIGITVIVPILGNFIYKTIN